MYISIYRKAFHIRPQAEENWAISFRLEVRWLSFGLLNSNSYSNYKFVFWKRFSRKKSDSLHVVLTSEAQIPANRFWGVFPLGVASRHPAIRATSVETFYL